MKCECLFSSDRKCVFIESDQYICLDRFLEVKNQNDEIMRELQKRVHDLESENKTLRDHMAFNNEGWEIDKNMSYILKDGAPAYKIKRKWNRGKEAQPSLEYLGA